MMGDIFEAKERQQMIADAEQQGRVSDSLEVRMALIKKMQEEGRTLKEIQDELKRIKREGKRNGQITRAQAYRGY